MNSRVIPRIQRQYVTPKHPLAFSSPSTIHESYKRDFNRHIPIHRLTDALSSVDSYTLHREYKKPKTRNPFFIYALRDQIQTDLIDMSSLAPNNDNVKFLLAVIDCFSKKAWIEPMENKNAITTLRVLQKVINNMEPKPKTILFDHGREFINVKVTQYLEENNIKIILPSSETKAAFAE